MPKRFYPVWASNFAISNLSGNLVETREPFSAYGNLFALLKGITTNQSFNIRIRSVKAHLVTEGQVKHHIVWAVVKAQTGATYTSPTEYASYDIGGCINSAIDKDFSYKILFNSHCKMMGHDGTYAIYGTRAVLDITKLCQRIVREINSYSSQDALPWTSVVGFSFQKDNATITNLNGVLEIEYDEIQRSTNL